MIGTYVNVTGGPRSAAISTVFLTFWLAFAVVAKEDEPRKALTPKQVGEEPLPETVFGCEFQGRVNINRLHTLYQALRVDQRVGVRRGGASH